MDVAGWGRYPLSHSTVFRPEKISELAEVVSHSRSILPRGAGKAYGDAALNDERGLVLVERLNRMLAFDPPTGILRCEAGVTLAEVIDIFLPRGFFPPVTPGTKFVTLGGSIAADIHGKNHHRDGSLSEHIVSFALMLPSGEVRRCSRGENADLFWATVAGMGLTGVITEVEIRLTAVSSGWIAGEVLPTRDIDQAMEIFESAESKYRYSVAWFDSLGTGKNLGRGFVDVGNFATAEELDRRRRQSPYVLPTAARADVPIDLPGFLLNPLTVRAFNAFIYQLHRRGRHGRLASYDSFFYPLDAIGGWNRIYGARGFVQYQCVWPLKESRSGMVEVMEAIAKSRRPSFLTVLKKFGAQKGMLSFPMPGYTLALDFPVSDGLFEFLDSIDEMVLKRGGRVYLAKDARMRPETFRAMYPDHARWHAVKSEIDPDWRFSSSLSRRLQMESQ